MHYISTRGQSPKIPFTDVLTSGLAPDGGLYVPEFIPEFSLADIRQMRGLSYPALVEKIITPFVGDAIAEADLKHLISKAYSTFRHTAIAPLKQLNHNEFLLELFHGPTLAFKDFALQLLGQMLDFTLKKRNQNVVIIGATSGDTGSAAIEGCRHSKHIQLFMLFPDGRVSDVQRRQMTTVLQPNIHNLAIFSHFDDCQGLVKDMFSAPDFLNGKKLVAVNSINWARIMAQIVYYFYAGLALGSPDRPMVFSVPTGNFGDIYAGYIASRMGLPIQKLIVATNQNDILRRFFRDNEYTKIGVTHTLSPSMDIQISSNFERLLFDMHNRDGAEVAALMERFKTKGKLSVSPKTLKETQKMFDSYSLNDKETLATIREVYAQTGEVLDPHSAIGVASARAKGFTQENDGVPVITLATAHPAKFPAAVEKAVGFPPSLPPHLKGIFEKEERFTKLPNEIGAIQDYIKAHT